MAEPIRVTGIVLKASPVGEYDRRIVILTKERGKIAAFARGARKSGSRLAAATNVFAFGIFTLYEGRSSYTCTEAEIRNYFEDLMKDYVGAYYGMYFTEVAEYYTRENNDEREMLRLLYRSLRAVETPQLPNRLVKCIYELKAIAVNGEFPGAPTDRQLLDSTLYALTFIQSSSIEKLYTFLVTDEVLVELEQVSSLYCKRFLGHSFKSLEILEQLETEARKS